MMSEEWSGKLLERWCAGDQSAADELFRRYTERLVTLARRRLPLKMAGRIDPEDVVQSVYRSFFAGAGDGRYELERGGDLWRLLVTITFNKLHHQVQRNRAGKRDVAREQSVNAQSTRQLVEFLSCKPSPLEAVALAEEMQILMQGLHPRDRRVLELRLQGYNLEEISVVAQCSLRTVCRVLDEIKQLLEARRPEGFSI